MVHCVHCGWAYLHSDIGSKRVVYMVVCMVVCLVVLPCITCVCVCVCVCVCFAMCHSCCAIFKVKGLHDDERKDLKEVA